MNSPPLRQWIVCQLGAREHYVIARGLHAAGRLSALITDIWVEPGTLTGRLPGAIGRRARQRHAGGLREACVEHFTVDALRRELGWQLGRDRRSGWTIIIDRNRWFQRRAAMRLVGSGLLADKPVVFAYSYAALDILRSARAAGCTTVLGQIDPGIAEEEIVAEAVDRNRHLSPNWCRAPASYWSAWRDECGMADLIVVNSDWARSGLIAAGIDPAKLRVVPLAYDNGGRGALPRLPRRYPQHFGPTRPIRVLFLGSLIVRKGIAALIEAIRLMVLEPVEFHLIGAVGIDVPADVQTNPSVSLTGPVPRGAVDRHYEAADLFILPTLSDGFGLTMIEAMTHGLPVIASRSCGDVVVDGADGILLDDVSGEAIAAAIRTFIDRPERLATMSAAALHRATQFDAASITRRLAGIVDRR